MATSRVADPPLLDPWLTTADAVRYTKAHKATLYRACAAGRLRGARLNGRSHLRFRRSALDAWLEGRLPTRVA